MNNMILKIVSPKGGGAEVECDSVTMMMPDDSKGQGGGSIGIQRGYPEAMIALAPGKVEAKLKGETVFTAMVESGFATVKDDRISLITDDIKTTPEE